MFKLLKDKYLLLPFVEQTDFIYTYFKITPNSITIINALLVSPLLIYFWIQSKFLISFTLLFLRNILDGVDGYIARKYKLISRNGEIYDHISDSIFIGFSSMIFLNKINYDFAICCLIGQIIIVIAMIINFSDNLFWIAENTVGAGGNYNGYCSLFYYTFHILLIILSYT